LLLKLARDLLILFSVVDVIFECSNGITVRESRGAWISKLRLWFMRLLWKFQFKLPVERRSGFLTFVEVGASKGSKVDESGFRTGACYRKREPSVLVLLDL